MTSLAASWRLQIFESLPSTSDHCRDLAVQGEPEGTAVLAKHQTAGRGSRGNTWEQAHGNLYLSVLLRPAGKIRDVGHYALLAGVAVADALATPGISLKWPNDIMLNGAKLGGILIDIAHGADGIDWLVIGMGVNLATAPEGTGRPVTALDGKHPPHAVAVRILDRLSHWNVERVRLGWTAIREAWLSHALPVGTAMTLRHGTDIIAGQFAGLADDAGLRLNVQGTIHAFSTGEIWLCGAETSRC